VTHDLCPPPAVRFKAPAALAKKHAVHPREADSLRTAATLLQIWGLNASLRRSAIVFREKKQKKLDWSKREDGRHGQSPPGLTRQGGKHTLQRPKTFAARAIFVFQELLNPPRLAFALLQEVPQVNCKLVLWLADWEARFWEWRRDAAC
jgi:hypothetical protein